MTNSRRTPSLLFGIAFFVLGGYVAGQAFGWQVYSADGPGPGFFPLVYGVAMAVLGLALAFKEITTRETPKAEQEPTSPILAVAALVILALSVPLMSIFGFVVGFGVTIFLLVRFIFNESWVRSAIVAAGIVVTLHVGFVVLLQASLPAGMFWGF